MEKQKICKHLPTDSQLPRTRFVVSLQVNVSAGERSMIWKNHERVILRYPPDSIAFDFAELVNAHVDKDKIKLGLSLVEQLQKMVDRFVEVQLRNKKEIDDPEGRLRAENVWSGGAKQIKDMLGPIK